MKFSLPLSGSSSTGQERTLKWVLLVVVFLIVSTGAGLLFLKNKGAPRYQGKVALKNLRDSVQVKFDQQGIPHISAIHEEDAFKTLGYLMAQDRLFQMDLLRRVARGRLSEVFGQKALATDELFRTLNVFAPFQGPNFKEAPETKKVMQAFFDGANQFISKKSWPFEYTLLGFEPEEFVVEDGYGILGYMAYSFAMGLKTDPLIELLHQKLGKERVNELRREPKVLSGERTVLNKEKSNPDLLKKKHKTALWQRGHEFLEKRIGLFSGSNAWALAPQRSRDGSALLASDPHVSFSIPGLWYEAHLKWDKGLIRDQFEFYGHFVPLLPFAALGHTAKHGWAVTISYIDDMDFLWTQLKTKERQYRFQGAWHELKVREEVIKVKGQQDYKFKVYQTDHGPLVGKLLEKFPLTGLKESETMNVTLKWGHHEGDNRPDQAFYGALMANNQREFEDALAYGRSPGLNVVYADKLGNIARYLFGTQYRRYRGDSGDRFQKLSDDLLQEAYEVIPFEERNHLINPDNGVVVSANQKPENSAVLKSGYFQPMDRYQTINEILAGQTKWTLDELKVVQTAPVNIFFPTYKKAMAQVLDEAPLGEKEKKVWQRLKKWQGHSPSSSSESLVFYRFFNQLQRELLPELDEEEFLQYCDTNYIWHHTKRNLLSGDKPKRVISAFKKSVEDLFKSYGPMVNWSLANEQTLTLSHPLSRAGAHLAFFLDIGPSPMDGGFNQINNMRPVGCRNGMKIKAGPSTRRLISFKNPEESYGILPLGNSGHYASPFFSNQWHIFKSNDYRDQLMRPLKEEEVFGALTFYVQ